MKKQVVIQYLERFRKEYTSACEDQNGEVSTFQEWCEAIAQQVVESKGNEDDIIAIADASISDLQANWL